MTVFWSEGNGHRLLHWPRALSPEQQIEWFLQSGVLTLVETKNNIKESYRVLLPRDLSIKGEGLKVVEKGEDLIIEFPQVSQ